MSRSEPPSDIIALEPNAILGLGGNRWLTSEGRILAAELGDTVELQLPRLSSGRLQHFTAQASHSLIYSQV